MAKNFYNRMPIVEDFNNEDFATSSIKLTKKDVSTPITVDGEDFDDQKFTVVCKRERVENHESVDSLSDALQERWNIDLQGVLDKFYAAGCFTAPDYQTPAKEAMEAGDFDAAHKAAQEAIDLHKFNVPKAKKVTVTRQEAQEVNSLKVEAEKLGMTLAQYIATVREMAAKGQV